jgi:AraC-like DNA-binding protein
MINSIYLAWMTCAGLQKIPQTAMFSRMVEEGRISRALNFASQHAAQSGSNKSMDSIWFRCAADMAFLSGHVDEANSYGQRALLSGNSGPDMSFNVLHIAAMKAVAKGDAVHAIRNYADMTHDQFEISKKCEGLAGMALSYLSLADMEMASTLAEQLMKSSSGHSDWAWLGGVIQNEIRVKKEWLSRSVVRDHVYWHHALTGFQTSHHPNPVVTGCQHDTLEPMLSVVRRRQLSLQERTSGQLTAENFNRTYEWGTRDLSKSHATHSRIEQAMVAIGHSDFSLVTQLLALFDSERIMQSPLFSDNQRLELSYCFYKLCSNQGHGVKAAAHYRNYLILSANRTRLRADVAHCCDAFQSQNAKILSDDVSARLPARYRRAYQYMQAHLGQNDLSVQEIADAIHVSARALQQAFKKYLGESPTEVLRRRRIEHVHGALLNYSNGGLIMDVAKKFGIKNRTTLTSEYRKLYSKLPSTTLRWGAVDSIHSPL